MARSGVVRDWHADRGFGFIRPEDGGNDVFFHISEWPRGSSAPLKGEQVSYALGRGGNGKIQAVRVRRVGEVDAGDHAPVQRTAPARRSGSLFGRLLSGVVIVVIGFGVWQKARDRGVTASEASTFQEAPLQVERVASTGKFHCDGREHCSQMTSCEEARYFLRHCPNVKMDGDNDGEPCEDQWCRGW